MIRTLLRKIPNKENIIKRAMSSVTTTGPSFETKVTELGDGRKISFREYGDVENGYPVFFMHGNLNTNQSIQLH